MKMKVEVLAGNILDEPADVLVSTANPWLEMTGGVNLGIILRPKGEDVYAELHRHLLDSGQKTVAPGTVVCTGPGSLPVKKRISPGNSARRIASIRHRYDVGSKHDHSRGTQRSPRGSVYKGAARMTKAGE